MPGKRKRKRSSAQDGGDHKRQNVGMNGNRDPVVKQALLAQYYQDVYSLRKYLLSKLPDSSKIRRRKIVAIGRQLADKDSDRRLGQFLDGTLIGVCKNSDHSQDERWHQLAAFSQNVDESMSMGNLSTVAVFSQSEVVDFSIWLMLSKPQPVYPKSQHLLCQGYHKDLHQYHVNRGEHATSAIPGVVSTYPNDHVASMKAWPWPHILALFGRQGERMMIDLLLDCGIFLQLENVYGSYHQLSGQPLGDLKMAHKLSQTQLSGKVESKQSASRPPSSINFVRRRMLYARSSLNVKGDVHFGLTHNHVLNKWALSHTASTHVDKEAPTISEYDPSTIQVMMYMFARQFGLHNVFMCEVDPWNKGQPFKDYTLRDDEITAKFSGLEEPKIPKRLRGRTIQLIRKLQVRHQRCPYKALINHYCPVSGYSSHSAPTATSASTNKSTMPRTQLSIPSKTNAEFTASSNVPAHKPSMMHHATPPSMVSAFCQAVLCRLIPLEFWGLGNTAKDNQIMFSRNVDEFVNLQKFTSFSLHQVSQGLKISDMTWLGSSKGQKLSQSDTNKRLEIFHEFLYYLVDSLLIPLIRNNFHVTESNVNGTRLFYFRHDVWRVLAEPAMTSLKSTMFEEMKRDQAFKILESRTLGYSKVRLVPKESGVRPIMNLKRKQPQLKNMNKYGQGINKVLEPIYNVLTLERSMNPGRLGSTMFSTGDLYHRLKTFKSRLDGTEKLYFAKIDVQAAFDTIPQAAVVALMSSIPSKSEYRISKHGQIKSGETFREDGACKPKTTWKQLAHDPDDLQTFEEALPNDIAAGAKNTIFVENIVSYFRDREDLLGLLAEHVQCNMVQIGKKFYRQKEGIPQGSVISSLLCNYFYADLEAQHLSFLKSGNTLLLRLIDDFLLITTNKVHARRFLLVMHDGLPSYGVKVNPDKTLVNFEVAINGKKVPRTVGKTGFPYCGSFIDTKTLDIARDRERRKNKAIVDSLTVECSKTPGRMFHRKMLHAFKNQSHAMFLDTSFNSLKTVLTNVFSAFTECALKMWTYAKCLPIGKQPGLKLLTKTIGDVIELAFVLMKSKGRNKRNIGYKCALSKVQVEWLALNAFEIVLRRRQSKYGKVLEWMGDRMRGIRAKEGEMCRRMESVVRAEVVRG